MIDVMRALIIDLVTELDKDTDVPHFNVRRMYDGVSFVLVASDPARPDLRQVTILEEQEYETDDDKPCLIIYAHVEYDRDQGGVSAMVETDIEQDEGIDYIFASDTQQRDAYDRITG